LAYIPKLPYGSRRENGIDELIHISAISSEDSGLKCSCVCPSCGVRLLARFPRTKADFTPHFAHYNADACSHATETAIHMKAKEIIEEAKHIFIPQVSAGYRGYYTEIAKEKKLAFDNVVLERKVGEIVPDIIAYIGNRPLMIEITVTHGIDDEKYDKIEQLGISTLEIDLSQLETNFDPETLYNEIITSTAHKYWIYNSVAEKEKEKLKGKYLMEEKEKEEAERIAEEKKEWARKKQEESKAGKPERVAKLLDKKRQEELRQQWSKVFHKDPIWLNAIKYLRITHQNIPEYLNVEIPGEHIFKCDRRIWQAYIFNRYVNNKVNIFKDKTFPISVERITNDIKQELKAKIEWDLCYLKDIKGYEDEPELAKVIYDYLSRLEDFGFLEEIPSKHYFYTKFEILDPNSVFEMRYVKSSLPEYKLIENLLKADRRIECKRLLEELIIKYNKSDQPDLASNLENCYDSLIARS
jgi:hypothetical protein